MNNPNAKQHSEPTPPKTKKQPKKGLVLAFRLAVIAVAGFLIVLVFTYFGSPDAIRYPAFQHYHFRMQIIANGKSVNFADKAFQEGYTKDNCNVDLTATPVHFHDNRDQMTHIHWDGMTGGLVLKYYGWNLLGGSSNTLGYRFDSFPKVQKVPIHGKALPSVAKDTKYFVYTGDENSYKAKPWQEFLTQDIEKFFGVRSNVVGGVSLLDSLFPKAAAHAGHDHETPSAEEELKDLNNLLGNVVIFAQKEEPTDAEIKARFAALVPLSKSVCGG